MVLVHFFNQSLLWFSSTFGVGGVGVLGDSTDSDSSGASIRLSVLGEVIPSVH